VPKVVTFAPAGTSALLKHYIMGFRFLIVAFCLTPYLLSAQAISIQTARTQGPGTQVTVRGIVTNGAELGKIRYMQDGTAGLAAYPGSGSMAGFEAAVTTGDSIEVTGKLVDYFGLLEISPITSYTVIANNRPLPVPKYLNLSEISEAYESQIVGFECVVFTAGGGTFSSGAYDVNDGDGNSAKVYVRPWHPLAGKAIPGTPVYLTTILSQYNDFQLLPRTQDDFNESLCFYYTDQLQQSNISTTGFSVNWGTNLASSVTLNYGSTPALGTTITVPGNSSSFNYTFSGLQAGTVYWVQAESNYNGNVILSRSMPFATKSLSSGQIKVYFNRPIDLAFANGYVPDGQSSAEVVAETIARINAAQQTLDIAMYNNNRSDITNAVKDAHNRGVRVRYVSSLGTSNTALNPLPAFPVIFGNSEGIMHDKFIIADVDMPDKCWVMSGSLNWTNQNINTDFNNTLFIQDQSLARTYQIEFEEMWGGSGSQPNQLNSRFGSNKRDNTPHHFIIGDIQVESWFSPSDLTTNRIVETVYTASSEALFATFSFTKNEIADALVDVFQNGASVRGMIENISDPGAELNYLKSFGIDCRPHPITGELHHKYGVFDANGSDPIVLTGSHNWSVSAETINDENTLVLHDARLASLFKAEFEKRWKDAFVSVFTPNTGQLKLFPNPATDVIYAQLASGIAQEITNRNVLGELVFSETYETGATNKTLNISALPSGQYFAFIRTQHEFFALPFQKI